MDSSFKIYVHQDANCVFIKHYGDLTLESVLERFRGIKHHPLYSPPTNFCVEIFDCENKLTQDDLRTITEYVNKRAYLGHYKNAVLTSSALSYGVIRMWQALTDTGNVSTEIFNSKTNDDREELRQKMLKWLNIDPKFEIDFWTDDS
ncbi:MAG: hypothetical protein JKY12_01525 [Sneathiella sp.]|nr:hypothetical protein [Sneathiella sp.]